MRVERDSTVRLLKMGYLFSAAVQKYGETEREERERESSESQWKKKGGASASLITREEVANYSGSLQSTGTLTHR